MKKVRANGLELNVLEKGVNRPLLLVHGFPLDHTMWAGQIDDLSTDFRVIAPDLRGFGGSDVTAGTVTMEQFADDLAALLDAMNVTEPIDFCGLSMGGYVAWQFFKRHRSRLRRMVLCDTRAIADSEEAAKGRRAMAERVLVEGSAIVADAMIPKLFARDTYDEQPALVEQTKRVMHSTEPAGVSAALRGMAERIDATELLPAIDVATMLICGEEDAISPAEEMRAVAGNIPGSEFVVVRDAGHMAPLEQPATVNAAIREFLTR